MWRAWIGFNVSHSLGCSCSSLLYGYLALVQPDVLFGSWFLLVMRLRHADRSYAVLAWAYWFNTPTARASSSHWCCSWRAPSFAGPQRGPAEPDEPTSQRSGADAAGNAYKRRRNFNQAGVGIPPSPQGPRLMSFCPASPPIGKKPCLRSAPSASPPGSRCSATIRPASARCSRRCW